MVIYLSLKINTNHFDSTCLNITNCLTFGLEFRFVFIDYSSLKSVKMTIFNNKTRFVIRFFWIKNVLKNFFM